jgi:PAS domain-containing protein
VGVSTQTARPNISITRGLVYTGRTGQAAPSDLSVVIHPDDFERAVAAWARAVRRRSLLELDCRVRRFDGVYRWHALRALPVCSSSGAVIKWIGTATDIDDAKVLEADLGHANRRAAGTAALLDALQSNAPIGLGFVDRDFRRVRVNETLASFHGSTVAEQVGRRVPDLVPEFWSQLESLYENVLDTGEAIVDVEVVGPAVDDPTIPRSSRRSWRWPTRSTSESRRRAWKRMNSC